MRLSRVSVYSPMASVVVRDMRMSDSSSLTLMPLLSDFLIKL